MAKKSSRTIEQIDLTLFTEQISEKKGQELLETVRSRFENNMERHPNSKWEEIEKRLKEKNDRLQSLYAMEITGGEPDVIGDDPSEIVFIDCSAQSPEGRRTICYDGDGQKLREKKGVYPAGNAMDLAKAMGIELLNEEQYRSLQQHGEFDTKTSSWIKTPTKIRKLGGALYADRRYDHVFVYHNSAHSFYSARGFRGCLRI